MDLNPIAFLADIRLGETEVEFVLLRCLVIARISFSNIAEVYKQTNRFSPFSAYRFVNRFGPRYVIRKKSSWFSKYVVVSPLDPIKFESKLNEKGVNLIAETP